MTDAVRYYEQEDALPDTPSAVGENMERQLVALDGEMHKTAEHVNAAAEWLKWLESIAQGDKDLVACAQQVWSQVEALGTQVGMFDAARIAFIDYVEKMNGYVQEMSEEGDALEDEVNGLKDAVKEVGYTVMIDFQENLRQGTGCLDYGVIGRLSNFLLGDKIGKRQAKILTELMATIPDMTERQRELFEEIRDVIPAKTARQQQLIDALIATLEAADAAT